MNNRSPLHPPLKQKKDFLHRQLMCIPACPHGLPAPHPLSEVQWVSSSSCSSDTQEVLSFSSVTTKALDILSKLIKKNDFENSLKVFQLFFYQLCSNHDFPMVIHLS